MFVGFWDLILAVLWALGIYWSYEVITSFREDLTKLRECEDKIGKAVIIGIWFATIVIVFFLILATYKILSKIASGIEMLVS